MAWSQGIPEFTIRCSGYWSLANIRVSGELALSWPLKPVLLYWPETLEFGVGYSVPTIVL
jgi:hypothetical protein